MTATAPTSATPLVLVVEDYDDTRQMFAEYLELTGFRVAQAADGLEAIAKASELLPDIILMDLSLPNVDGREAIRRLKADERTAAIPIVLLTGMPLDTLEIPGTAAQVNKPCMPDELARTVRRVLDAR